MFGWILFFFLSSSFVCSVVIICACVIHGKRKRSVDAILGYRYPSEMTEQFETLRTIQREKEQKDDEQLSPDSSLVQGTL